MLAAVQVAVALAGNGRRRGRVLTWGLEMVRYAGREGQEQGSIR